MAKIDKVTIHSAKITVRAELDKDEARNLLTINEEALAQVLGASAVPAIESHGESRTTDDFNQDASHLEDILNGQSPH